MNLDRSTDPNLGSGKISRLGTSRRRGISFPFNASVDAGWLFQTLLASGALSKRDKTEGSTYSAHAGHARQNRHLGFLKSSIEPFGDALMKTAENLYQPAD
jgi:hypothetical protein